MRVLRRRRCRAGEPRAGRAPQTVATSCEARRKPSREPLIGASSIKSGIRTNSAPKARAARSDIGPRRSVFLRSPRPPRSAFTWPNTSVAPAQVCIACARSHHKSAINAVCTFACPWTSNACKHTCSFHWIGLCRCNAHLSQLSLLLLYLYNCTTIYMSTQTRLTPALQAE
jgi:hypothetical protein